MHHLVRVRRVRPGEEVEILNGRGACGQCEVVRQSGRDIELKLVRCWAEERPPLRVHLLVALPKGKTFPTLLHKAVELGVSEITPMTTANSEVELRRPDEKMERWETILVEAVKQSGNPWKPVLKQTVNLEEALARKNSGERLCAALQPGACPLWQLLGDPLVPDGKIQVFVGPEGDFTGDEYAILAAAGCHFVSLGPLVLKVETAATLVVGALRLWSLGKTHP